MTSPSLKPAEKSTYIDGLLNLSGTNQGKSVVDAAAKNIDGAAKKAMASSIDSLKARTFEGWQKAISVANNTLQQIADTWQNFSWENIYKSTTGIERSICYVPSNNTSPVGACAIQTLDCIAHLPITDFSCCTFSECHNFFNILPPLQPFLRLIFQNYPFLTLNTSLLPPPNTSSNSGFYSSVQEAAATLLAFLITGALIDELPPTFSGKELLAKSIPWGAAIGMGSSFIWGQNSSASLKSSIAGAVTQTTINVLSQIPRIAYKLDYHGFIEKRRQWLFPLPILVYILSNKIGPSFFSRGALIGAGSYMLFHKKLNPWASSLLSKASPFSSNIGFCLLAPITAYTSLLPISKIPRIVSSSIYSISIATPTLAYNYYRAIRGN